MLKGVIDITSNGPTADDPKGSISITIGEEPILNEPLLITDPGTTGAETQTNPQQSQNNSTSEKEEADKNTQEQNKTEKTTEGPSNPKESNKREKAPEDND